MEPLIKIEILTHNLQLGVNAEIMGSIPLIWAVCVKFDL